jgi:hypothetical protein
MWVKLTGAFRRGRQRVIGSALLALLLAPLAAAQQTNDVAARTPRPTWSPATDAPAPATDAPRLSDSEGTRLQREHRPSQDHVPRWLDAVRAQRRTLQADRRAQHQARRRAIDPVGTARQEALEQAFQRRRQEMRNRIAGERWLFINFGPWATPWPPAPIIGPMHGNSTSEPTSQELTQPTEPESAATQELPDWDNGWYFNGW